MIVAIRFRLQEMERLKLFFKVCRCENKGLFLVFITPAFNNEREKVQQHFVDWLRGVDGLASGGCIYKMDGSTQDDWNLEFT